jgi:hypothetical protein
MNWLRNNKVQPEDLEVPTDQAVAKLTGVPFPSDTIPPVKEPIVEHAVGWLRNNNSQIVEMNEPPGSTPAGKKGPIVEEAMEWLRNSEVNPDHMDVPTLLGLSNLAGLPMPQISIPNKEKKVEEAMN